MAVSFGANLALVRLLTPTDFGRFAVVVAIVGIVSSVVNFRLEDVLLRIPDRDLEADRLPIYGTALMLEVGFICLGSILTLSTLGLLDATAVVLVLASMTGSWVSAQSALYERQFEYRRLSMVQSSAQIAAQLGAVVGAAMGLGAIALYLRELMRVVFTGAGLGALGEVRWLPIRALRAREWRFLWARVRGFWGDGVLEQSFDRLVIAVTGFLAGEQTTGWFYQARLLGRTPARLLMPLSFRIRMNQFAHHTEAERRIPLLLRSLGLTTAPLLGLAAVSFWFADPLIPWLFGAEWRETVPLFVAMLGLIPGIVLMDTIKAYFMATGEMQPFLWIGRGGQYISAVTVSVIALWGGASAARALAFGLSAAYIFPVLILVVYLRRIFPTVGDESSADTGSRPIR